MIISTLVQICIFLYLHTLQMYKPQELANPPKIIKRIGEGTYGEVYVCIDGEEKCAVKKLKQRKDHIDQQQYAELIAAKQFRHPNIVNASDIYVSGNQINIKMEFCDTNIESIFEARPLKEERKEIYRQLLSGLNYLHSQSFLHCDIKPKNILIKLENEPGTYRNKTVFKILDFGLGCFINQNYFAPELFTPNPHWKWTDGFRPPEVMAGVTDLSLQSDVWSLGVSFMNLLLGTNPFVYYLNADGVRQYSKIYKYDILQLKEVIFNNGDYIKTNFEELDSQLSRIIEQDELEFIHSMLELDVRKRLSCQQLLDHPFLQNINQRISQFVGQGIMAMLEPTHQQMFGQLTSAEEDLLRE